MNIRDFATCGNFCCCRNINGFLNTSQGGKIYLGVLDDGVVAGLALSEAQVKSSASK